MALLTKPKNYSSKNFKSVVPYLPLFSGKRNEKRPEDDMYWQDVDGDEEFDFGEFFNYDETVDTQGCNVIKGIAQNKE